MVTNPVARSWLLLLAGVALVQVTVSQTPCVKKSFITFNTYLTNRLINYTERAVAIRQALTETDVDIICLQEVHHESDMAEIIAGVQDVYPYHYSPIHSGTNRLRATQVGWWEFIKSRFTGFATAPCAVIELVRIATCLVNTCGGKVDRALVECLLAECPDAVTALGQDCRTCLAMADQSITRAIVRCIDPFRTYNRFNTFGLMFLSKHPITTASWFRFIPDLDLMLPTAYMDVTVENVGRIICTHLTAYLGPIYIEYNLLNRYSGYEEQNKGEIEFLNTTYGGIPHVLLGDLNSGPNITSRNLFGPFPNNYALYKTLGYKSVYVDNGGPCTLCDYNPLEIFKNYNVSNFAVDHVMSKNFVDGTSQRVLETYNDLPLSDHYGVQVEACFEPQVT